MDQISAFARWKKNITIKQEFKNKIWYIIEHNLCLNCQLFFLFIRFSGRF